MLKQRQYSDKLLLQGDTTHWLLWYVYVYQSIYKKPVSLPILYHYFYHWLGTAPSMLLSKIKDLYENDIISIYGDLSLLDNKAFFDVVSKISVQDDNKIGIAPGRYFYIVYKQDIHYLIPDNDYFKTQRTTTFLKHIRPWYSTGKVTNFVFATPFSLYPQHIMEENSGSITLARKFDGLPFALRSDTQCVYLGSIFATDLETFIALYILDTVLASLLFQMRYDRKQKQPAHLIAARYQYKMQSWLKKEYKYLLLIKGNKLYPVPFCEVFDIESKYKQTFIQDMIQYLDTIENGYLLMLASILRQLTIPTVLEKHNIHFPIPVLGGTKMVNNIYDFFAGIVVGLRAIVDRQLVNIVQLPKHLQNNVIFLGICSKWLV